MPFPDCFVFSVKWEARSVVEHGSGEGDTRAKNRCPGDLVDHGNVV